MAFYRSVCVIIALASIMTPCAMGFDWNLPMARKAARIMKNVSGRGAPSKEVIELANQILAGTVEVEAEVIAQVEGAMASTSTKGSSHPLRTRRAREVEEDTSEEEESTEEGDDYPGGGGDDGDGGEASKGEWGVAGYCCREGCRYQIDMLFCLLECPSLGHSVELKIISSRLVTALN